MLNKSEPYERTDEKTLTSLSKERRAINMVRSFMERSRKYREPHMELAMRSRDMYENWQVHNRSLVGRANLRLPFGFTIIETQLPQLADIFLQNDRYIKFEGRTEDDYVWENLLTDFHQKQFQDMNFSTKFVQFLKSNMLDGTAIAKVPYRFQEIMTQRRVQEQDPLTGEITTGKQEVPEVVFDGPDFEPVALVDFYPDWQVKSPGNITGMRGCVHRTYRTFNSLKRQERRGGRGIYKNLDKLKMSTAERTNAWAPPSFDERFKEKHDREQDNRTRGIKDGDKIEVWEYWGLWDPNGDGNFEEYILTIANGDVLIREDRNFYDYKFKPFVAAVNYPRDGEFYGISELLAVRSLIKEANQLRNARLDTINLAVNPMWLVDKNADINAKNLFSRPGGLIFTRDMNGIRELRSGDPSVGAFREFSEINQDIQNATALLNTGPQLSQLGKTFGRSATGVQFINNLSSSRISIKARLISELVLKRVAHIMMMTNRQFVTEPQWIRSNNPADPNPFRQLPPDAFFTKVDFIPQTDIDTGGPEAEFQKLQLFAQLSQVAEQSQPGTVDFAKVFDSIGRTLFGKRVDKFTRSEQERLQLQQQQLAAEQAANAQAGASAPQPNEGGDGDPFNGGGNFL